MTKRAEQRERTRDQIVGAAAGAFAELGFQGASTREIAKRAETNQGLITYHFNSKDELWRAAADRIFSDLKTTLRGHFEALETDDPRARAREAIRHYVRYAAAHPELFRLMVEAGKHGDHRMDWLVDTHLKPMFLEGFFGEGGPFADQFSPKMIPHAYYVLAGAGSVIFAVAPECRRLTGLDPETDAAVETHADFLAWLLVP